MSDETSAESLEPARQRHIPWVTIAFAATNILVFGWQIAAGADPLSPTPQWLTDHGGNLGPLTLGGGETWRLLSSMFLHVGLLHIAMNMVGLIDGGRHVERMYGRAGFFALYLVSGLGGGLASALRSTNVVSAGASGAIFGVFGAFGAFLFLHRHRLDTQQVARQARGLMIFLAYNLYFGLTAKGIDMLAHIGGLAVGFGCGIALEIGTNEAPSTLRRAILVGVIGTAAIIGAARVVPSPTNQLQDALADFGKIEGPVNTRFKAIIDKGGSASDESLGAELDRDVIAPWHEGRLAFERDAGSSSMATKIDGYLRAREEAWRKMSRALHSSDSTLLVQSMHDLDATNQMLDAINDQ